MPPLPPTKYVLEALQNDVLPAAGGGALVLCLFLLLGRWAGALGSAAAIAVAFLWSNFTLTFLKLDDKPTWDNTARLLPWKPAENAPGWHWMPKAALLLVLVGLLSRWIGLLLQRNLPERYWWGGNLLVWAPRLAGVIVVSGWLASGSAASAPEWQWLRWQVAAAMFLIWIALDGVARADFGAEVAAYLGITFFVAGDDPPLHAQCEADGGGGHPGLRDAGHRDGRGPGRMRYAAVRSRPASSSSQGYSSRRVHPGRRTTCRSTASGWWRLPLSCSCRSRSPGSRKSEAGGCALAQCWFSPRSSRRLCSHQSTRSWSSRRSGRGRRGRYTTGSSAPTSADHVHLECLRR